MILRCFSGRRHVFPATIPRVEARPGTNAEFWSSPVGAESALEVEKYERLLELASSAPNQRRPLIRGLAVKWPAATREAEMIGPVRTRERLEAARKARDLGLVRRAEWWAAGAGVSALWPEIHGLLRSMRDKRQAGARTLDDLRDSRWSQLHLPGETRISSRHAYLVLAQELGAEPRELFFVLFARPGHWDWRPGDPQPGQTRPDPI